MIDNYKISLNLFKSNSQKKKKYIHTYIHTYIYIYVCVYLILLSQLSKLFGGIGSIKFLFINLSQ